MAHLRENFPVLENLATGAGESLNTANAGETAAGKKGLSAFAFKDASGNFVLPTLTSEGKLPVDMQGAGVAKKASAAAEVAGSATLVTVAEISLTTDKVYGKIMAQGSCFREAELQLIQQDDVTETIVGWALVGPGHYNGQIDLGAAEITAGASGTQKLILKAKNIDKLSPFLGQISCLEYVAGV